MLYAYVSILRCYTKVLSRVNCIPVWHQHLGIVIVSTAQSPGENVHIIHFCKPRIYYIYTLGCWMACCIGETPAKLQNHYRNQKTAIPIVFCQPFEVFSPVFVAPAWVFFGCTSLLPLSHQSWRYFSAHPCFFRSI